MAAKQDEAVMGLFQPFGGSIPDSGHLEEGVVLAVAPASNAQLSAANDTTSTFRMYGPT